MDRAEFVEEAEKLLGSLLPVIGLDRGNELRANYRRLKEALGVTEEDGGPLLTLMSMCHSITKYIASEVIQANKAEEGHMISIGIVSLVLTWAIKTFVYYELKHILSEEESNNETGTSIN